jgi:hypothetical protein
VFERRRAIDARTRQIVEESGVLWAVARDQAKKEIDPPPIEPPPIKRGLDDPWALLWIPAALVGQALIVVPIWLVVGAWIGLSCGDTVSQPCDDLAESAQLIWTVVLGAVFLTSAVRAYFRHLIWLLLPIPASVLIGVCAVVLWELSQR